MEELRALKQVITAIREEQGISVGERLKVYRAIEKIPELPKEVPFFLKVLELTAVVGERLIRFYETWHLVRFHENKNFPSSTGYEYMPEPLFIKLEELAVHPHCDELDWERKDMYKRILHETFVDFGEECLAMQFLEDEDSFTYLFDQGRNLFHGGNLGYDDPTDSREFSWTDYYVEPSLPDRAGA